MKISILKRMASVYAYTAIAALMLFVLYMNLPYWYDGYQSQATYAPKVFIFLIAIAGLLFITDIRQSVVFLKSPYAKWCIAVLVVHILNAIRVHVVEFPDDFRIEAVNRAQLFILAPTIAYLMFRVPAKYYARFIGVIAILCPVALIANFISPELFDNGRTNLIPDDGNRISAFWLNPNIAGEMVILGVLMAYRNVGKTMFTVIVVVAAVGIALTASRSGLAALVVIVLALLATGKIPIWIVGFFLAGALLFQPLVEYADNLAYDAGREGTGLVILDRVDSQIDGGVDVSSESREDVALIAIQESADKMFLGHGHSFYDTVWEVGTHNMLLAWAYLYGITGVLLWGGMAYCLFRKTFNGRELLLPCVVFVWYSMFSHNLLELPQWFIFFGWIFSVTPGMQARSSAGHPSDRYSPNHTFSKRAADGSGQKKRRRRRRRVRV